MEETWLKGSPRTVSSDGRCCADSLSVTPARLASSRHQALRPTRSVPSRRRIEDDPFRVPARRSRATFFRRIAFRASVPGERALFSVPVSFFYYIHVTRSFY